MQLINSSAFRGRPSFLHLISRLSSQFTPAFQTSSSSSSKMPSRTCASCQDYLPRSDYSNNQWAKGPGVSRCISCVHGYHEDDSSSSSRHSSSSSAQSSEHSSGKSAGRLNLSDSAAFSDDELEYPFAQGHFRWVARGAYTSGDREGESCVGKWFKKGTAFEETFFEHDIKAVNKALEIIEKFNRLGIVNKTVRINIPEVWTRMEKENDDLVRSKMLIEPFITRYQKFNSNTGWKDDRTPWPQVMQALSHFSYHITGGRYVLCDLQGGIYQHEVVLTDPVILSRNREFGVTDLGPKGISNFFSRHRCNNYCRPYWSAPSDQRSRFRATAGTAMVQRHVPTASSRAESTRSYYY